MIEDNVFRVAILCLLAVVVPFALYGRIRSNSGEKLDRWQEGAWILFGLRLGALPCFIGIGVWMFNPSWMLWASLPIPTAVRWIGVGLIGLSGGLLIWTFHHLGKNLTDTVVTRKEHALVTTGPYRYVRHPFYLSVLLLFVGMGIATANWFLGLAGTLPFVFLVARTRIEEAKLVERFGDDYRSYMSNTPGLFPKFW